MQDIRHLAIFIAWTCFLAGCASAPSQGYRPANYGDEPWNISGDMNQFTNGITIKINDRIVIDNNLSLFAGDGEFSGNYQGKQVTASCLTNMFATKTNCFVFVSGDRVATPDVLKTYYSRHFLR